MAANRRREDVAGRAATRWRWRRRALGLALAAVPLVLFGRAIQLQVVEADFLHAQARARQERVLPLAAHRGLIVDRRGEPLAVSTPMESIWASPRELAGEPAAIAALAQALERDPLAMRERIERYAGREFLYVARHRAPAEAQALLAQRLPGVYARREYRRYYPLGEVTGALLGTTDIDDRGQSGLERLYDRHLTGRTGRTRVLQDRHGGMIHEFGELAAAEPGRRLELALDARLQYVAYRALKEAMATHRARSGSVVLLDVASGGVLAMVNQPASNPNGRRQAGWQPGRNRAVTDQFEPGSSMKPLIVAAALEHGVLQPQALIDTHPGWHVVQGKTIKDRRDFGVISLADLLVHSSNVGASKIALALPPQVLHQMLRSFGFGEATASLFPGESPGRLDGYDRWRPLHRATIGYGYGISVSALQLAQAYSVLAADGLLRPPSFLKRPTEPPVRVLQPATAQAVRLMLEQVVIAGSGKAAQLPGYRIGGKTGTAHKSAGGRYDRHRYVAVFAGLAPVSAPRVVAVVMIDEPSAGQYYGGAVAAPVFRQVVDAALRLLAVPPDALPTQPAPATGLLARLDAQEAG